MKRTVKAWAILHRRTSHVYSISTDLTGKRFKLVPGWKWIACTITYDDGKPGKKKGKAGKDV